MGLTQWERVRDGGFLFQTVCMGCFPVNPSDPGLLGSRGSDLKQYSHSGPLSTRDLSFISYGVFSRKKFRIYWMWGKKAVSKIRE